MYYTYMLRCENSSIYTGITNDVYKRMNEHFSQNEKCAKYTKRNKPVKLLKVWESDDRKLASKLEYHIKKDLNKEQKENIVVDNKYLEQYLGTKIDVNKYKQKEFNICYSSLKNK